MHRDGYGFVMPEPGSLPARAQGKLQGDIFIPPPEVGNAMHGDQVLVEMGRIRQDGKAEGRIVRVMEREQETVVGIFHYGRRPQLCNADRRKSGDGDHDPAGHGISQTCG